MEAPISPGTLVICGLLLAVALAGCVDDAPIPEGGTEAAGAAAADDRAQRLNETLADMPEFCETEDACDYWDLDFHQYVVYDLDTVVLDVVIVPPAGGSTPDMIAASRQAVQAWRDGILELAEPWFAEAFEVNIYAVGVDVPRIDAVQDPEIVVVSSSAVGLVGIGLEPVQIGCEIIGQPSVADFGGHRHGDGEVAASNCAGTGFTCFALNVGAFDPRGLYDLIAHEVGHCLGAGHVGDALDFRARYAPIDDIMSYQADPEHVHCVSNMDVRVLEGVYAHLLDRPEESFLPRGSYYAMSPLDYAQVECANPPGME